VIIKKLALAGFWNGRNDICWNYNYGECYKDSKMKIDSSYAKDVGMLKK
jgi:hypothetical protein